MPSFIVSIKHFNMRLYLIFFLLTLFACKTQNENSEVKKWEQQASNITIIRDHFGVPHIYGKTDADAVFGLLYAQCEDDFKRVERNYIWATGHLAEIEGEKALYSDLRANLFMTEQEAKNKYEQCPEWLKKLCVAFADGINYYLHTHPDVQPALITHFEPWMPMYFSEGSIGGDIESISANRIEAFYKEDRGLALTEFEDGLVHPDPDEEPQGSNGIAISGNLTESGNAMLLINPHTSFYFRGEVHVVSEEGLNAYGAVTWGQFFVYQGFNEKTGWMHTSTYTDVIDEFKETVIKRNGELTYVYGDDERPVLSEKVTLHYLEGETMKSKEFLFYRTHHGPITHMIDDKWVATAMMWDPPKALEQSFIRTKLNNLEEFNTMMEMHTNSSNNTVFADASGNIAYYHGNFIPKRDERFDYSKPVDGSNPETDWQGLHSVAEAITVINPPNGWIQNCNSTPFTSAGPYSPVKSDYPRYMSIDRENFRGIHAIQLLSEKKNFNLDNLITLAYDSKIPAFELLTPGIIDAYDKVSSKNPDLEEPIEMLRSWDFRTSTSSVAMTIAHFYGLALLAEIEFPDNLNDIDKFKYFITKTPASDRLDILNKVIQKLNDDFGSWKTPWGEVNRFQRLSGDIDLKYDDNQPYIPIGMASGKWGALASFGARTYEGTKRIYGSSGNSFVAVVEFGEKVKAKSMLAGGQSGDPQSPHFYDQAQRYADVKFKDVLFYKEDLLKNIETQYHPGEMKSNPNN